MNLQVELDAFSGRPNPRWDLKDDQAAEFLKLLRGLSPAESAIQPPGLGYRGFIVRSTGEPVGAYDEVRIFRGTVVARRGARVETFGDPERVLEGMLLDTAREHVDEPVLQYIRSEIGR
jgi:hypothetical protein